MPVFFCNVVVLYSNNFTKLRSLFLYQNLCAKKLFFCRFTPLSIWLLVGIVFLSNTLKAQFTDHYYKTLTPNEGLLGNLNAFMFKDSRGFMWISSMQGLNRYDGQRVRTYKHDLSNPHALLNSNIQSEFFEDKNSDIWFSTGEAIHVYRRQFDHFDHYQIKDNNNQLITNDYYVFHFDTEGYLWLRIGHELNGDLYRWHTSGQQAAIYMHPFVGLRAIAEVDKNGRIKSVLSYMRGGEPMGVIAYVYDNNYHSIKKKKYFSGAPDDVFSKSDSMRIVRIFTDSSFNVYWLATRKGLLKWDKNRSDFHIFSQFGKDTVEKLTDLVHFGNQLWVSALNNKGVYIFDTKIEKWVGHITKNNEDTEGELSYPCFNNLYLDNDANLWLARWDKGINYSNLRKNKFTKFRPLPASISFDCWSFMEDEGHNVWISGRGNGVIVLNPQRQVVGRFEYNIFNDNVVLYKDLQNRLWGYTQQGKLFLFDKNHKSLKNIAFEGALPQGFHLNDMKQLQDGRILLASSQGLYEIIELKKAFLIQKSKALPATYDEKGFFHIFENQRHEVILNHGQKAFLLCQFDKNQARVLDSTALNSEIYAAIEFSTDDYYFTSNKGLLHIKRQNQGQLTVLDTVFSGTTVNDVLKDKNNNLWVCTEDGIMRYNPSTHQTRTYSMVDGLQGKNFGKKAMVDHHGNFWMGGLNGVNVFKPEDVKDYAAPPKLEITDIKVNNAPMKSGLSASVVPELTLPFKENNIEIEFVAIDYSDSPNDTIRYAFGLASEQNPNWVTSLNDKPSIHLFNLSEGTYIFRLRACNSDGYWTSADKILKIKILPPWYRSVWFYCLCILGIGLVFFWWFKQREKRIRTQAAFEQKITETEMRALRSQMDPHFIYNSLNSINAYILRNVPVKASLYLTEFAHLMRKILNYSQQNRISLEKEEELLRGYMTMEALRFDFDFDVEISDELDAWETQIPTMILQPFVENAIIHGIHKKTEGRGFILIKFEKDGDYLLGIIEDNGVGLQKSVAVSTHQREKSHVSKGIQITRDRLAIIAQQTGKEASVNLTERSPEQGGGTRVTLKVPI